MNDKLKMAQDALFAVKQELAREMQKPERDRSDARIFTLQTAMQQQNHVISSLTKYA